MALNYTHRSVFPAHLPDDNLVSPIRIGNGFHVDGVSERRPWRSEQDFEDAFDYGRNRGGNMQESSNDILDVLPSDPFGMDISSTSFEMDISTTFTALTGWLEDLEVDYGGYGRVETRSSSRDYELFAGLNFIWNNAMRFQSLSSGDIGLDDATDGANGSVCDASFEDASGDLLGHDSFPVDCHMEDMFKSGMEGRFDHDPEFEESQMVFGSCSGRDAGPPHAALHFALAYLGLQDLLAVERVCKSLRATVKSDPLLWRSIYIDQPLNERITDEILLLLTSRAQGNLQCLSLVECPRITDEGLKHVLQANPRLTKLSVPACTRLSIEGVVNNLKAFSFSGLQGIKQLRIGGLYGVTEKHFEELTLLLGSSMHLQKNGHKPHFYFRANLYVSCEDDRAIDIEECPKCQNLRLVYDCPAEGCQGREDGDEVCRACTLCIARCGQCGRCINDSEYEETFCLELRCSECLKVGLRLHETGCDSRLYG